MPASQRQTRPALLAGRPRKLAIAGLSAASILIALAGCGDSDKPQYCTDRSSLESAVKEVPGLVTSANISGLQTQIASIKEDAQSLAEVANIDFPTEAGAVTSSVTSFDASIKALPSSPSASQVAGLALEAATMTSAVRNFMKATDTECE